MIKETFTGSYTLAELAERPSNQPWLLKIFDAHDTTPGFTDQLKLWPQTYKLIEALFSPAFQVSFAPEKPRKSVELNQIVLYPDGVLSLAVAPTASGSDFNAYPEIQKEKNLRLSLAEQLETHMFATVVETTFLQKYPFFWITFEDYLKERRQNHKETQPAFDFSSLINEELENFWDAVKQGYDSLTSYPKNLVPNQKTYNFAMHFVPPLFA